jgi:hypothetical protein
MGWPRQKVQPVALTIELNPEIEARLLALADAQGLALPQYVQLLLGEQFPANAPSSANERAAAWRDSVRGLPHTPPLSDESTGRESIYGDRVNQLISRSKNIAEF